MSKQELTLIVAATNRMGIGKAGTLPWTKRNAVIMGRKTWESIPARFQPLKDRMNIIITRNTSKTIDVEKEDDGDEERKIQSSKQGRKQTRFVNSLESALSFAQAESERAFVIGGAQIYQAALALRETKRILLTRILNDFDFDTKFPLDLSQNGKVRGGKVTEGGVWERKSHQDLNEWTGEIVPEGIQEENGIQYSFEMWVKNDDC